MVVYLSTFYINIAEITHHIYGYRVWENFFFMLKIMGRGTIVKCKVSVIYLTLLLSIFMEILMSLK